MPVGLGGRVVRWIAGVLLGVALLPAPASAAEDIEFWVWRVGHHTTSLDPVAGQTFGANFGAQGPLGARVAVTIDLSNLDSNRVTGFVDRGGGDAGCVTTGTRIRCEWTIDSFNVRSFADISVRVVPGAALGPAGKFKLSGERLDEPDASTANNTSEAAVDVRGPGDSNFSVRVDDARGSIGETVTVPVTIANAGPNTLREVTLNHPTAGGGRDFKGGNGCVTSPVPLCAVDPVPPGATKVVNLRFYIRRCFQPVPGDPDYGASTLGDIGLRWNYSNHLTSADAVFELKVNGCAAAVPGPGVGPGQQPPASAAPSPSIDITSNPGVVESGAAFAADPAPPAATRPVSRTAVLASRTASVVLGLMIIVVLVRRRRQRRDGL